MRYSLKITKDYITPVTFRRFTAYASLLEEFANKGQSQTYNSIKITYDPEKEIGYNHKTTLLKKFTKNDWNNLEELELRLETNTARTFSLTYHTITPKELTVYANNLDSITKQEFEKVFDKKGMIDRILSALIFT